MIKGLLSAADVVEKEKLSDRKFLYEPLVISGHVHVNNSNITESLIVIRKALGRLLKHFDYDNKAISSLCGISVCSLKKIFISTDVNILDIARITARFSVPISVFVEFKNGSEKSSIVDISPENLSANLRSRETWDIEKEFRKEVIELIKISSRESKSELRRAIALLGLNGETESRILRGYYWTYDLNTLFSILMYVTNVRVDFDFSELENNISALEQTRNLRPVFNEELLAKKREEVYEVKEFSIKKNQLPESIREQRDFFFYFARSHGYAMRDIGNLCGKHASMISNVKLKPTVRFQSVLNVVMMLGVGIRFRYYVGRSTETTISFTDKTFNNYNEAKDFLKDTMKDRLAMEVRTIFRHREMTLPELAVLSSENRRTIASIIAGDNYFFSLDAVVNVLACLTKDLKIDYLYNNTNPIPITTNGTTRLHRLFSKENFIPKENSGEVGFSAT